jgi:hypothetical protein
MPEGLPHLENEGTAQCLSVRFRKIFCGERTNERTEGEGEVNVTDVNST